MKIKNIFIVSGEERKNIVEELIQKSYPGSSFYILAGLASFIAAIGLIVDNIVVVIGSMLVAPLLYPIVFLGMSVVISDFKVVRRTFIIIVKIMILGVSIGFLTALVFKPLAQVEVTGIFSEKILFPFFYISIASGLAASFAIARKSLQEFLPGVAVSISLIPPLINAGVAIGFGHFSLSLDSLQIFLVNITGIILASIIVFYFMGFTRERKIAKKTIKEEEKHLKKGSAEFNNKK